MEPGPVFIPALTTNHFFSSLLFRLFCHSRQPLLRPPFYRPPLQLQQQVRTLLRSTQTFYHFDFNGTFPITTTPVRFTRPEVHTLPTFPERRSSWPQRDGRSTTLPRSSTTTRPPLSHTHSLFISLSVFLSALMVVPSFLFSSSPSPAFPPPPSLFAHPLPNRSSLSHRQFPSSSPITSAPFYVSSSPSRLSNYHQTVSFRYTDVVSPIERNLAFALALMA